jgi:putative acetyltransferase
VVREQRPEDPEDRAAVRRVITEAFGDEGIKIADLAEALAASPNDRLSLVADQDGLVVGHVQLSRSWVDAPARLVEVLVLSPLSVLPADQSRGVGKQLVARAIEEAGKACAPLLFLEGSPAYYSRLGFQPGLRHGFSPPSLRIPDAAFQVVLLPAYEPWMTGALVYNEVFWAHDCVGLR